ncbi:peptidyl-prolyl cis-trans isomerase FKBP5 isoform X4 [Ovis aries]|uniref:peptidyl-prolyl cis-trans isomerase FKBP5 isoform X4 n=1 Tax=Ovis aries TaxID=9940 RepID=UPI001C2E2B80|nr:peptidyl-prolyl cis-trans isomerase FKBP5 isoform X3 [Ovis aries]XP_060259102.1 peptidyl-prolyl cis-trans isomerase FKBP5 isoform X4 [Ovis aries]
MTTDEAAKNNGESPAAAVAEQGEDITSKKDRGVLKIVKRVGNSEETPMIGDKVYVHYRGKLSNGKKFDSSHDRNEPFVFSLGKVHLEGRCGGRMFDCRDVGFIVGEGEDHDIPIGIDKALEKMQREEQCILYLGPRYGFGEAGKPKFGIEPNAELIYEVTLKSFEKAKESWEMDTKEKLEQAAIVKEKGTVYFKGGKYMQAVIQYGKIVSWLEMEYGLSEKESKASESFLLAAFLNLAMCYLKLREYTKAVECCDKPICLQALGLDSANEKGLYRRGEAQLLMNEFESAKGDFEKVLEVNPQNKAARLQISMCQKKAKEHNERDRRIYANMFKKFAEQDAKEEASKAMSKKTLEGVTNEKEIGSPPMDEQKAEGHV